MTIILLIRHGDTDYLGDRLAGCTPGIHLNANGIRQAELLAQTLSAQPIKAIFSSPLERTLETARPLAQCMHLPIRIERALLEVNYGKLTGMPFNQLTPMSIWKQLHETPSQVVFPGGEAITAIQQRAVGIINAIASQFVSHDLIACFSHGDIIRLALAHYLNMPLDSYPRLFIQTTSISVITLLPHKVSVLQVNQLPGQAFCPPPAH